ncbi:MAG: phosphoglycerate kinase [Candidatus Calescibacterium sp.]|nr:phosphoglycerate kinase [Candidatus Calescibacterium sp.]MCX7734884.1 phosphoglycerate kinase [bacterium]MDW8086575.1 phosphoglycerate kinase [Candidatus Calescibacterium sp.]
MNKNVTLIDGIKFIDENNIRGAKALVRVDFNVPIDETGQILDDRRVRSVLPTINYLLDEKCKVVILSHMGRPKGKRIPTMSLAPVAKRLSRLLEKDVLFVEDCIGEKVKSAVRSNYDIILLENVRYYAQENENNVDFAKQIKESVEPDIYVNDAFAVSHRKHASVYALPLLFEKAKRYAGNLMKKELLSLERLLINPQKPFVAIVGGAKVSDKIGALKNILSLCDKLIIGGAMAFTFLEAMGYKAGKSLVEKDFIPVAKDVLSEAAKRGIKVYLPVDCIIAKSIDEDGIRVVPVQEIPDDYGGYDIGPATIALFSEALADAKTIVWNGPMGVFEKPQFSKGTFSMVSMIANSTAYTVVGGGDTDVAVIKMGEQHRISYISTGGGAFLQVLEGKELPGIEALKDTN